MFQGLGIKFTKSIRRRLIVNSKVCIKKQMRLTNIYQQVDKPTRFTYRIEYINNSCNFIPYLTNQG